MRYIRAGNFPFWKHSLTNKLFELLCVSYFSNIQTHPHQLPLQWLKRIFTSFCRWPSSWSSLQVTLMHVSSPTVHLQVNARWCQHWLHLNSTKRLVCFAFPHIILWQSSLFQCTRCGPALSGRCFGPSICCSPMTGCNIGGAMAARCALEAYSPQLCSNSGQACGVNGKGICALNATCCTSGIFQKRKWQL